MPTRFRHVSTAVTLAIMLALVIAGAERGLSGQSQAPFTADDMLRVATASVLDLTEDGSRVAVAIRRLADNAETDHRRFGDPTYIAPAMVDLVVFDTRTGHAHRPFSQLMNVRQASWSRDGLRLAVLTAAEGDDRLPVTTMWIWSAGDATLREVPRTFDAAIAPNSDLAWWPDGSKLLVALRDRAADRAARATFQTLVDGPVVVHTSAEKFLEWDALRRGDRLRSLAEIDPGTGEARVLLPAAKLTDFQLSRDGSFISFREDATERTDYDVISGTQNHLRLARGPSPATTLVDAATLKTATPRWSDDGRTFGWADKGEVFVQRIDDAKARSLTPKPDAAKAAVAGGSDLADAEEAESFSLGPFNPDGSKLLITSKKGWYVANVDDATRQRILDLDDKNEHRNPRVTAIGWTPRGDALLVQHGEADRWERGVVRLDATTRQMTPLVASRHLYQGVRFSRDGSTVVYLMSDGDQPAELYAADAAFRSPRRLTDLNPWMAGKALPRSELVAYRDVDGKQLYGVLRYPVGYEQGRTYPTVFELYETFFDNGFNARAALLANHGYAVFHPSVHLVVGRPGEAWTKGVTSAANRLIDMGIADPDRLGVHGTSYGGYATVLLITETDRFKAAINISGKVNMVSFYTDSPRLGVRNTHAPEKSQDRIGGTLWEYPERYLEHSAVLRADRIKTPLLNITGDQDPNVPASQSREIYYALRRLGQEVEWVRYVNGGHRPPNSAAETIDFENRIVRWYDRYLKRDVRSTTSQ
jgi:dipeptidyl aminopeptidase/acylaminoacyl peptidase